MILKCRSCNAPIVFLKTAKEKTIPVNAETVKPDDKLYDAKFGHISHFATCPDAAKFSRKTSSKNI